MAARELLSNSGVPFAEAFFDAVLDRVDQLLKAAKNRGKPVGVRTTPSARKTWMATTTPPLRLFLQKRMAKPAGWLALLLAGAALVAGLAAADPVQLLGPSRLGEEPDLASAEASLASDAAALDGELNGDFPEEPEATPAPPEFSSPQYVQCQGKLDQHQSDQLGLASEREECEKKVAAAGLQTKAAEDKMVRVADLKTRMGEMAGKASKAQREAEDQANHERRLRDKAQAECDARVQRLEARKVEEANEAHGQARAADLEAKDKLDRMGAENELALTKYESKIEAEASRKLDELSRRSEARVRHTTETALREEAALKSRAEKQSDWAKQHATLAMEATKRKHKEELAKAKQEAVEAIEQAEAQEASQQAAKSRLEPEVAKLEAEAAKIAEARRVAEDSLAKLEANAEQLVGAEKIKAHTMEAVVAATGLAQGGIDATSSLAASLKKAKVVVDAAREALKRSEDATN